MSSGQAVDRPRPRPQLTILQDSEQILERYDDYEDDAGELRAESTLTEKFCKKQSLAFLVLFGSFKYVYIYINSFSFFDVSLVLVILLD